MRPAAIGEPHSAPRLQDDTVEHVYAFISSVDILTSNISPSKTHGLRQVGCLIAGILIALALLPSVARADSGGATINTLPDSSQLEGHVEVSHECGGVFKSEREQPCQWFAETTQYPASVECPGVYDGSHGVWVGPIEQGSATSSGSFSFIPEASEVVLCLYIYTEGTSLVGHSHPFDTRTSSEVSPGPIAKVPSRASLTVDVFAGCSAHIYSSVDSLYGEPSGKGKWTARYRVPHHAKVSLAFTSTLGWEWSVTGPPGTYRFSARYDGDPQVGASSFTATTFRLRRCTKLHHIRN